MADRSVTAGEARLTTKDSFLGGRLVIEQPAKGFRAGLDAVLLAAAVPGKPGDCLRVLDAGAGVGTAGLCVAARMPNASATLVEISPELAGMARCNIERNGLGGRARVVEADVTANAAILETAGVAANAFDAVIANPPYLEVGRHRLPEDQTAADAFGMRQGWLELWLKFMARAAAANAALALIHRADALAEVLKASEGRFGALRVLPVHPRQGEPAHRIIVTGRKGSRAPLQLMAGLILHGPGNEFLPQVKEVLRDGAGLPGLGLE